MKLFLRISCLVAIIFAGWLPLGNCAQAQSGGEPQATGTAITGVVVSMSGSRMEIRLLDGQIQSVTAREALSPEVVGKKISGRIVEVGDTYLILDPSFSDLNPKE